MGIESRQKCEMRVRALAGRVKPVIRRCVQTTVDLIAPDVCYLCGKPARRADPASGKTPSAGPVVHLEGEAVVKLLRMFSIANHPFCNCCLSKMETPKGFGQIGYCGATDGGGWVETVTGEIFVHQPGEIAREILPDTVVRRKACGLDVISPFMMNDLSLGIVRKIKFSNRRSVIPLAAGAMAAVVPDPLTADPRSPVLVPVPMHRSAFRKRGFNQSALLAVEISRRLGLPNLERRLHKTARTRSQSVTAHDKRAQNVRGIFTWTGEPLDGKHVFLVDDLVTTGMTAASCASVLMAAGAWRVSVICFARAF